MSLIMGKKLTWEATIIYDKVDAAIKSGKYRYIILEGGSRSSKTTSLMQIFYNLALNTVGRLTIWRKKRSWLIGTVYVDFQALLIRYKIYNPKNHYKSSGKERFKVRYSTIEFNGMDDVRKLLGFEQDYAWINEGMEISKDEFDQIDQRTKYIIFIDYNPYLENHFVYDLELLPETLFIPSTILDNPFVPIGERRKIESYEPTPENIKRKTADKNKWDIYGLGKRGKLEGRIFDYKTIKEWPEETNFLGYGLDFGYTHPSACAKVGEFDGSTVVQSIFYETALQFISKKDEDSIEKRLNEAKVGNKWIIADSAQKTGIAELRTAGFNIKGVKKYAGSVKDGIKLLKQGGPVLIVEDSIEIIREFQNYIYIKDPYTGKITDEPIDDYNHFIDLIRYVRQTTQKTIHTSGFRSLGIG